MALRQFVTIEEKNLDDALSRPWSGATCLIAQAFGPKTEGCTQNSASCGVLGNYYWTDPKPGQLQELFDSGHYTNNNRTPPRDWIMQIRMQLPYTFEVERARS